MLKPLHTTVTIPSTEPPNKFFSNDFFHEISISRQLALNFFKCFLIVPLGVQAIVNARKSLALGENNANSNVIANHLKQIDGNAIEYGIYGAVYFFLSSIAHIVSEEQKGRTNTPPVQSKKNKNQKNRLSTKPIPCTYHTRDTSTAFQNAKKSILFTTRMLSTFIKTAGCCRVLGVLCDEIRPLTARNALKLYNHLFLLSLFIATLITIQLQVKPALKKWLGRGGLKNLRS